ncbi:MAG TPA: glycosyltransferase, partial [Chryseolinea sp.]
NIFAEKVSAQLRSSGLRYLIIRGVYSATGSSGENEVEFLNSEGLQTVISQASLVLARSGYSTIMDLAVSGKKGILVPTPGQTEQEYLADRWKRQGVFYSVPQHDFNLQAVLEESKSYTGFTNDRRPAMKLLSNALDKLLNGQIKVKRQTINIFS